LEGLIGLEFLSEQVDAVLKAWAIVLLPWWYCCSGSLGKSGEFLGPNWKAGMQRRKFIDRNLSHIDEIDVPYRGLRGKWDAMSDFKARDGIKPRGRYKGCRWVFLLLGYRRV
jgi:hypothetical protein